MGELDAWYVKRGEDVSGPFPAPTIFRDLVLGRIRDGDHVSRDGKHWADPARTPEFADYRRQSVGGPAFAQFDERLRERRGTASADPRRRRGADRRRAEPDAIVQSRARSRAVWDGLRRMPERHVTAGLVVALILIAIAALAPRLLPPAPAPSDCNAAPAPRVNWRDCARENAGLRQADLVEANLSNVRFPDADLAGARLLNADLSYADLQGGDFTLGDLRGARLFGANLREADLAHANLSEADLRYADLTRARLDGSTTAGTRFDHAIWPTGTVCAPGSVGICRRE